MPIPETPPRRVWLVRHGESDWNVRGLAQGQAPGPVLTTRGAAECGRAARALAGRPISAIFSSDLTRARQSARIIGAALNRTVTLERALRERSLGCAEGWPSPALARRSGIRDGRVEDAGIAPEGGETIRQLYERATGFAGSLEVDDDADTILVTHGGVIRVLLAWAHGAGPQDMAWPPIANGAVVPCQLPTPATVGAGVTPTTQPQRGPASDQ